jgi:hypothetical protein
MGYPMVVVHRFLIAGLFTLACSGEVATAPASAPNSNESPASSNQANSGTGEPRALDMSAFMSVSIEARGGYMCTENCGYFMEVRAPGQLVLSDDRGMGTFELFPEEYDGIRAVLARPEFFSALQDPDDCYGATDGAAKVSVTLTDGTTFVDGSPGSCFLSTTHPYGELIRGLRELRRNHFPCPAEPIDETTRSLCHVP